MPCSRDRRMTLKCNYTGYQEWETLHTIVIAVKTFSKIAFVWAFRGPFAWIFSPRAHGLAMNLTTKRQHCYPDYAFGETFYSKHFCYIATDTCSCFRGRSVLEISTNTKNQHYYTPLPLNLKASLALQEGWHFSIHNETISGPTYISQIQWKTFCFPPCKEQEHNQVWQYEAHQKADVEEVAANKPTIHSMQKYVL